MEQKEKLQLVIEQLEERIAPGVVDPPNGGPPKEFHANNGWGNGEDAAPGNSLAAQAGFEDGNTGASPSNSAASANNDR